VCCWCTQVAPNQYEFAPQFGNVIGQIDNNLMVMQICEEVCAKHGLVCLMQEKPFANINGSGKHNNWSLSTKEGAQLFNPTNLAKNTGNTEIFPVIMSCMVRTSQLESLRCLASCRHALTALSIQR
jgi:glutamine synthetase